MYSCSPTLSQISLKNSFGKVVFQILAKIEMTRNKNRLFCRHFETVRHFNFCFFSKLWFFIVHTYMVQISLQNSGWKVVFLRGVPWNPPWAPTGVKVGLPWSLISVKVCSVLLLCSTFNAKSKRFVVFETLNMLNAQELVRNNQAYAVSGFLFI